MFGLPVEELFILALSLIVAGAIAGLLAGLFGIGGGAIFVPVLFQFFEVLHVPDSARVHVAIGTSLAIIAPTSLRSYLSHRKRGAVDQELLGHFFVSVPLGVVLGAIVASYTSGQGLIAIFAAIAFVVAIKMLFGKESWRISDNLPGSTGRSITGIVIGFFSTLMGIGGGIMTNTFMTLYNRPIHQAIATSSGVGVLISIPGAIGFIWAGWGNTDLPIFSVGFVNFLVIGLMVPVTILFAPLGVRLAHKLPKTILSKAFGIFLLLVSVRFVLALSGIQ
ncbi:MAG: sulfite exporter TauE/SafE family protein [Cohaesibacteraceae bacterium]|nr:sulfite exporter TauE/SafE family protein [Cohaesibacteraceae bacterium]MBL4876271.1 sulfite exporter TauE/SafE family protein [Cohaesibacteraceae bacterium]